MRRVLLVSAVVVTIVVVGLAGLYAFQRKLIYQPSSGPVGGAPGGRDVTLQTADGFTLDAWYFPAPEPLATVLVAPGNGGDRSMRLPLARALTARRLSVLLMDYRGFGGNPGEPTEPGLALDVRAARAFLVEEAGVRGEDIVYFGESLGAAVVTELAVEHPPRGLLLRSPFTELAAVARYHYPFLPVRWLLEETYPVARQVRAVDAPVTVVYGTADRVVPPGQSRAVAIAAGARQVRVDGAGHNDPVLLDGERLIDAVVDLAT